MIGSNYDVVVVGAGAAGLTAAIGLARAGFGVAVVEAAAYPGAENWSGCVYFCENLAQPDILGSDGVEALAWERRLVERGFFSCDGHSLLGLKYREPNAFQHCYTVLRPIFDHHLAQVALHQGVALLTRTTAESLIREMNRVIGVSTNRGPLYADLVFLAEGDASHLVTREGYERFNDQREAPKFLQGIKQVIDLPPGAIEELFGVGAQEGVAYEMVLRNGTFRGKEVHLNMGGFLYTNRQSLSIGLVLPADNLKTGFDGDPNLLMEWFAGLPALEPWLKNGKRGVFGAKIIRGGGVRDIPYLVDDGLAIGGAASAIGIDFPYPNFTGPATAMGRLIVAAVSAIRHEGTDFTKELLRRHYLEPLQQTHYWKDVEFLKNWPSYIKKTKVFFGQNIDLVLGSAYVWTRPRRWFAAKWVNWLRLMLQVAGPAHWREFRHDLRHFMKALRLREVLSQPQVGRLLLDGTINTLRDLSGTPRANLPSAGTIRVHYSVAGETSSSDRVPFLLRGWFRRLTPVLASAAGRVYRNDDVPLSAKLPDASQLMLRQLNILDLFAALGLGVMTLISGSVLAAGMAMANRLVGKRRKEPGGLYPRYARAAKQAVDMTRIVPAAAQHWDERLGQLAYETVKASHIHLLWPRELQKKNDIVADGIWHVCPAHVYEARVGAQGQLQVVVNFENCIKCETCWRTSDLADWGRDGAHRFIYPVVSPVVTRLLSAVHSVEDVHPIKPRTLDRWQAVLGEFDGRLRENTGLKNGQHWAELGELEHLLACLKGKLGEFDAALAREPRTIDRGRGEYLDMLARYAQQLAMRILELSANSPLADNQDPAFGALQSRLIDLARTVVTRSEERARRTWDQRFAWAAVDGRQLGQHHLVGMERILELIRERFPIATVPDPISPWLRAEEVETELAPALARWRGKLDSQFPAGSWREIDRGQALNHEQDSLLQDLIVSIPAVEAADLKRTLHPPLRKALLAELGRRDPSLAYRVAAHLWARDMARLHPLSAKFVDAAKRWARGEEWACFATPTVMQTPHGGWIGEALLVPAAGARTLLLVLGNRLALVSVDGAGVRIEPQETLGLRGAGVCRICIEHLVAAENSVVGDQDRIRRVWQVLSAADLTSIAYGMVDQLCRRTIAHAKTRVQFPGLFHDEEARDPIGKFGAVKKMVAQIAARRYLLETLDHTLSPADFSSPSVELAGLVKALAAEALGTGLDSATYCAGQVFGGTGYSEDDILSKYYRDAAAWRFLGPPSVDVYRQHGEHLLRTWQADGRRLARLPNEGLLFDQLVQRTALQAELDEVRVFRSRLRGLLNDWQDARKQRTDRGNSDDGTMAGAAIIAQMTEETGRQSATLLAAKALVLRTHARQEACTDSETEVALLRVWLGEAGNTLEKFEGAARHAGESLRREPERPIADPGRGPPLTVYADYLGASCPYDSGDFLIKSIDVLAPRLVPEMLAADPVLAARDLEIRTLMDRQFGPSRGQGLPYERYIERQHRPDQEDLDFCRRHGFFRMTIPRELGGEGRQKVDYYLLTTNAQRRADVAISLTIQVNTGIGTTPIFLAREKDLPKAQKELGIFAGDPAVQREIETSLVGLIDLLTAGAVPQRVLKISADLQKRLNETVLSRGALRALAFRFVQTWQDAGRAGKRFDMDGMKEHLQKALAQWRSACVKAEEMHSEIGRRLEACALYLRWIASGQISAFALTEPSAGSDTARVATRAGLESVLVETEPDGVLRFTPAGGHEPHYLLDARRLVFRPDGVHYVWSDQAEPARIQFDEYDYETDDPACRRYYLHGTRRVDFTDIAQLRERNGQLWYDYWLMTGSKMWITNGRVCGVMALYAKTEEGVTGFVVDRHAEGLVVGKDEAKMGQLGSPTNEISLQSVRVPRENVLGVEGRGQVNALETLNVGRAGLAMSGMAQMAGLVEFSRAFAHAAYGDIPDWVAWRLQSMEEERFSAEALAQEVVGRFEHPGTKSVQLESAISKMQIGELLHHIIELAEEIHGLAGQTQAHLIEKRKRDARILNIYEGTNEIQRFFILKTLAGEIAPRWSTTPEAKVPGYHGAEALELETLRNEIHRRLTAVLDVFGADIWQNPNLQANCFLLAEAVAWFKTAESTLARLAWLERDGLADENAEPSPKMAIGRGAFARGCLEVRVRLRHLDEELTHLRRGFYAPEIRAASLLFDRTEADSVAAPLPSRITSPLSVLVIVEPTAAVTPHPYVDGGRLLEPYLTLSPADRSALELALRLRDQAQAKVTISVVAVGSRGCALPLREALSLGADRARLLVTPADVTIDSAARALASVLAKDSTADLILTGAGASGNEEGLLASLTSSALGIPLAGQATWTAVTKDAGEIALAIGSKVEQTRHHPLPAAVAVEAEILLRSFTAQGYLSGLTRVVEFVHWPEAVAARAVSFELASRETGGTSAEAKPHPLDPAGAARYALDEVGMCGGMTGLSPYDGPIEDVPEPVLGGFGAVAILACEADGQMSAQAEAVLRAGALLASKHESRHAVVLIAPQDEESQRRAVAYLPPGLCGHVLVLATERTGVELNGSILENCWADLGIKAKIVVGESWAEEALARLSMRDQSASVAAFRLRRIRLEDSNVVLETIRGNGKLRVLQAIPQDAHTSWLSLAAEAEIETPPPSLSINPTVQRWSPHLERFYAQETIQSLLNDLRTETGIVRLCDAEFIIDVGFGVGNRDGYEAVIEPLEQALRNLGVRNLAIGGSRKVTEELHLLPSDHQIGQSGVSVNPQVLLAIGISGAPQHLNYLGPRAAILAFNRDPEAPLLTLNERQARPRVYPVIGDLFETVPAFTQALKTATRSLEPEPAAMQKG